MRPLIINDHSKIEEVCTKSEEFLKSHDSIFNEIGNHIWAYNEIGTLVPQTVDNFWSGHFFPFAESYYELENSYQFCFEGFYRHAFSTLRCVLELAVIGLYFDKGNQAHVDIQEWLHSVDPTPYFQPILKNLFKLENFEKYNDNIPLQNEIVDLYSKLSNYVHVRGYQYSSSGQSISNFNQFKEKALVEYVQIMTTVVKYCVTMMLIKYPLGMQVLPLWAKFGLNSPMGGLLDESSQDAIFKILNEKTKEVLQEISDNDPNTKLTVQSILEMPDLTEEELDQQNAEYEKEIKDHIIKPTEG